MPSNPTLSLTVLLACATVPNLLLADELLNGMPVEVLARSTVEEGGRRITFVRIRPPASSFRSQVSGFPQPPPAVEPSAAALAEEARLAAKTYVNWQPFVTVHLRQPLVSELRFQAAGREVTVWANVDFRALCSVNSWESATTVYDWFPFIGELGPEDDTRPADLGLAPGPAEYVVEATAAELAGHEADFAALETLLAFHDLNRESLVAEQARRAALEAAQEAERARQAPLPPPKPKDEIIFFWKNENHSP